LVRPNAKEVRYEKEFEILLELSQKIVMLRDSAKQLRPDIDYVDPSKTEDEIKRERLNEYREAASDFYSSSESKRPFYPEELYEKLRELDRMAWSEAVQYKNRSPQKMPKGGYDPDYWEKAADNAAQLSILAENAIVAIRERIKRWESLRFDEVYDFPTNKCNSKRV